MVKPSLLVIPFAFLVLATLLAPLIAPYDPMHTDPARQLEAPSRNHLLGTDLLGRDVLSRALYGGQHTLLIAGMATLIAVIPGVLLGLLGAVNWVDRLVTIFVNAVLTFPGLLLALLILTLIGQGAVPLAMATGFTQLAPCARITRSAVISVMSLGYVESAYSLGARQAWVIVKHVLPNVLFTVLAYTAVIFAYAILNSAALSFLGLGGEPGIPDWGVMLAEGRQAFRAAPWIAAVPGFVITLTVVLANRITSAVSKL